MCAAGGSGSRSRTSASMRACSIRPRWDSRRPRWATSTARRYLPRFDFDSLTDIGDNLGATTTHSIYSFQPTVTRALRQPLDACRLRLAALSRVRLRSGRAGGRVRVPHATSRAQQRQLRRRSSARTSRASCSACRPAARIDRNAARLNNTPYHGMFVQDDWKVVRAGSRSTSACATSTRARPPIRRTATCAASTRRRDQHRGRGARGVCRQPDSRAAALGVQRARRPAVRVRRATAGSATRTRTTSSRASGFAYSLNDKTVVRGGWGIYTVPAHHLRQLPAGLLAVARRSCPRSTTGLTFRGQPGQPVPDGVLAAGRATLGADTFLGQELERVRARSTSATRRTCATSISVQRELPGQWLVEAAYAGSRGWDLTTGGGGAGRRDRAQPRAGAVPLDEPRARSGDDQLPDGAGHRTRSGGCCRARRSTARPIARQQLLRPFPHFDNVRTLRVGRHEPLQLGAVQAGEALHAAAIRCWPATRGRSSPSASSG